ncbi:hypothetical protein IFM89_026626 [Coptis chinensis]|uniref:3-phosphoshikimate 1-carboxyvinyltransferase n=1 Tax=Coptis chinensis TaxID=261450 RepID=A0A835M0U2_9MAGN|nr:hypothetical protein IFM89_026626 [Coptis chinensis]
MEEDPSLYLLIKSILLADTSFYVTAFRYVLDGVPRMRERPIGDLVVGLKQLGADVDCFLGTNCPPIRVNGNGGFPGESSQYLTSLLMAAPLALGDVEIEIIDKLISIPYVEMTLKLMERFGEFGVDLETRFLLYEPPGCGKTLIAKQIANDAGANFIHIKKSLDKPGVPKALRETCKQRLLNALKQTQQRLGDLKINFEDGPLRIEATTTGSMSTILKIVRMHFPDFKTHGMIIKYLSTKWKPPEGKWGVGTDDTEDSVDSLNEEFVNAIPLTKHHLAVLAQAQVHAPKAPHGGSKKGRKVKHRNYALTLEILKANYFVDRPVFPKEDFKRRFRDVTFGGAIPWFIPEP